MKAVVQFRGREIAHVDLGKKLLLRFAGIWSTYGTVEGQPRLEGRNAHVLISPLKKDKAGKSPRRQNGLSRPGNRADGPGTCPAPTSVAGRPRGRSSWPGGRGNSRPVGPPGKARSPRLRRPWGLPGLLHKADWR